MKDVKYLKAGETVKHGESVTVECEDAYYNADLSMECYNGKWQQEIDCSDPSSRSTTVISTDATTTVNGDSTTESEDYYEYYESLSEDVPPGENQSQNKKEKGCKLSDDERYTYEDSGGNEINPGSNISDGTTLTVTCTTLDLYEFNTDYDYGYDTELTSDLTITCNDNTLSQFELDCLEVFVAADTCTELQHGTVKKENGYYNVSCDKGYSLDLIDPTKTHCTCENGKLKSLYGNQEPACKPDNCVVPYEIDERLSVRDKNRVSLSGGSVVKVGDVVYFNCSKAGEMMYEPLNRAFKCSNGLWKEAERDQNWSFGKNGEFPVCREAICEPDCTNGGICFKDDNCRCKDLTEGKRCENAICDPKCFKNGGKCIGSGKCDCPEGRFGSNCEQAGCTLPENAPKVKSQKMFYRPREKVTDFECEYNEVISSATGMTCQEDGSWSNSVQCLKAMVYLIRVKTDDRYGKSVGTDAKVYIYLHGPAGRTNKLNLQGDFERNDLDETRIKALDVRPISYVTIGHEGSGTMANWCIQFVSIFVENMNEYYVFRKNGPVWVYENEDVLLPRPDCVLTFDKGTKEYPHWNKNEFRRIGDEDKLSLRGCLQGCTELSSSQCNAVVYNPLHKTCWGLAHSYKYYFSPRGGNWKSHVYRPSCLQ